MTALTPRAQLLTDLAAGIPKAAGADFATWGDDTDLSHVAPTLVDLIDAAHERVRGLRAATVIVPTPAGPVPAAALRSSADPASVADFSDLWGRALDAVYGKPRTIDEIIVASEVPVAQRLDAAFPGVVLACPADGRLTGEYTLLARGADAVRQLAALLDASLDGWPLPDWVAINRRQGLLRDALRGRDAGS
ncbi:hypothetical protein ACFU0X_19665 [Streptomyces cellulosae]|uniref:Uncharacterized protein n=1 Tax=Streptomyces cellulosae TaxID=1968 RepID=A0ABW6JLE9_STRCE